MTIVLVMINNFVIYNIYTVGSRSSYTSIILPLQQRILHHFLLKEVVKYPYVTRSNNLLF